MKTAQHIVNISGGKDSTACYLLALERGRPFRAVMADTGNEHPDTIEYRGGGFRLIRHINTRHPGREGGANEADRLFRVSMDFTIAWRENDG